MEGRIWNVLIAALRTLVTAQQIKNNPCHSMLSSCVLQWTVSVASPLSYVLVVVVVLSLLGKVHLAKWNDSQTYCNNIRKFVVYYKQKACESALTINFLLINLLPRF